MRKAEIVEHLFDEFDALHALLSGLNPDQWSTPSILPGWTVHDIASHVVGTELFLLGERTPDVTIEDINHVLNPLGDFNEHWVLSLAAESPVSMLELLNKTSKRRRQAVDSMSDEDWNRITASPVGQVSYGDFMRVRLFDTWMHELDIRDSLDLPTDEGGARAELALTQIYRGLPRVIGKGAQAPAGAQVRFELTGPVHKVLNVIVNSRAEFVDELDGEPTVTVSLPSSQYARLTSGRSTADPAAARISGDQELGSRIVSALRLVS